MIEKWLTGEETLVSLGFENNDNDMAIFVPLSSLGVKVQTMQKTYTTKVIIKRIASGKVLAIDVPIVNHQGEPYAKWIVYKQITSQPGIISFQVRSINKYFRLLATQNYRGIIFATI